MSDKVQTITLKPQQKESSMINVFRAITMASALTIALAPGSLVQAADANKTAVTEPPIVIAPSIDPFSSSKIEGAYPNAALIGLYLHTHTENKNTPVPLPFLNIPFLKIDILPDHPEPALKPLIRVGKGSHCLIAYNDLCLIAGEHLEAH